MCRVQWHPTYVGYLKCGSYPGTNIDILNVILTHITTAACLLSPPAEGWVASVPLQLGSRDSPDVRAPIFIHIILLCTITWVERLKIIKIECSNRNLFKQFQAPSLVDRPVNHERRVAHPRNEVFSTVNVGGLLVISEQFALIAERCDVLKLFLPLLAVRRNPVPLSSSHQNVSGDRDIKNTRFSVPTSFEQYGALGASSFKRGT